MTDDAASRAPLLRDVAKLAGVSVPTVSRVISGALPVSEEKRKLVRDAIAELNYVPNPSARALATGTRNSIAVLVSDATLHGYASIIAGIEDAARESGYGVLISVVGSSDETAKQSVAVVMSQSIAGVIVLDTHAGSVALEYIPKHLPMVYVGSDGWPGMQIPHVKVDDRAGAFAVTRHLIDLGHERIHYIAIPFTGETSERIRGWREALDAAGLGEQQYTRAGWDPISAYDITFTLVDDPQVTAIFCGNDDLAFGALRALNDKGLRVPEDVSVVGFDDLPISKFWPTALTTVSQDFRELGRRAFDIMRGRLAGDQVPDMSALMPTLVVRESTGPASTRRPRGGEAV